MWRAVLILPTALVLASAASAETYVVNPGGTGDFPTIQAAIDFGSDGDVIELTDGTFTGDGNRDIDFLGKAIAVRSQSGDPTTCIIDCEGTASSPHRGFRLTSGEGPNSVLESITITNGYTRNHGGGAVFCSNSTPTFLHCGFTNNTGWDDEFGGRGGAVLCGNTTITDCVFIGNRARMGFSFTPGDGGALFTYGTTTVTGCEFIGNAADDHGAAISADECQITLRECAFVENTAGGFGGAAWITQASSGILEHCWFEQNEAWGGSALALWFSSSPTIDHCSFTSNAGSYNGVLDCWIDSSPLLTSCTFYGNSGPVKGTAVRCEESSFPMLENCIVSFGSEGAPFWCDGTSAAHLTCCDVYGNAGGDWVGCIVGQFGFNGNISGDPLFCDVDAGLFTLQDDSPCAPDANPDCGQIGAWPVGCTVHLVTPDGTGEYPTIQAALEAADDGDIVRLASGVFTGSGNRDIDYLGKAVRVHSTELDPVTCVIDCEGVARGCVFQAGEGAASVLQAVTIRNGHADRGGAVLCEGSSPRLCECILVCNSADDGGALFATAAGPALERCTLAGNSATRGGGIYSGDASGPVLTRTIIANSPHGEALFCDGGSGAVLSCCDLFGNAGGDWVGYIAQQLGADGNISEDPLFCGPDDLTISNRSPCAPFSPPNDECDLIGACPVGCWVTLTVESDGSGDYPTIQAAIDAASEHDVIELGVGTFTGDGNRDLDPGGKALTIRSRDGDPQSCILDCGGAPSEPHRGFHIHSGEDQTTIIEGLTITGGLIPTGVSGGAVHCVSSSPTLRNCILTRNEAYCGGALNCREECTPAVTECTFSENEAMLGAGVYCREGAQPTFSGCVFQENTAVVDGGGIYCISDGRPLIRNTDFLGNRAGRDGGGLRWHQCEPRLEQCLFAGNSAGDYGGAIAGFEGSSAMLQYCTLSENAAPNGGAIYLRDSSPWLCYCIIAFSPEGVAVYSGWDSQPTLGCCDIYGNAGGDWCGYIADQLGIDGNICADPLFCGPSNPEDPHSLQDISPCAQENNPECGQIGARVVGCSAQGIGETDACDVGRLRLSVRSPSPLVERALITYGIPPAAGRVQVCLSIHDVCGRRVRKLVAGPQASGIHTVSWDGTDERGRSLHPGVYILRLVTPGEIVSRQVVVLR